MAEHQDRVREFPYTRKDFDQLRKIANAHTGIVVNDDKYDMYYARLTKRLRTLGIPSFSQYINYLKANEELEFTEFINSITTNLTSFFRENHHFEALRNTIIPHIIRHKSHDKTLRIWSSGCSTGEEPYSIAMVVLEELRKYPGWQAQMLASDIDSNVLETAARGVYGLERVNGLSQEVKKRWFFKGKGRNHGKVRVNPALQKLITFKQINLMHPWPVKDQFDIIFCRNVVIYFDNPTKKKLINRFYQQLLPESYLIMGHSESLQAISDQFLTIGKTMYRKKH